MIYALIAVLLLLPSSAPLLGQQGAAPLIEEVEIRSASRLPVEASYIRAHTSLKKGDRLSRLTAGRDVKALLATGRFSDVQVIAEPVGDGMRLVYEVAPKARLAHPVAVEGSKHFRDSRIREWIAVEVGDFVDPQAMGVGIRRILDEYRQDYFPDARVHWDQADSSEDGTYIDVTLHVKEGRKARLADVRYHGYEGLSLRELRSILKPRPRWNPLNWFRRADYDQATLADARRRLEMRYRNAGYLDVKIDPPAVRRNAEGNVIVDVNIGEGRCYRFGDVALSGSGLDLFPEAELRGRVGIQKDAVASAGIIRDTARALRDVFGSRGYLDTRVRKSVDADPESGVVNLRFDISEGQLTRIRNIRVRGNTRTHDKVIRRELLVYPGEIYDEVKIRRSERIVQNLGFFSAVRSEAVDTRIAGEKDLVFAVEEKRTGQFMVGAGFSSIDKMVGFVELSQGNFDIKGWPSFTGAGQKLKLNAQFGSRRNEAGINFVEPWFMDRKLSFGLDIYTRDLNYTDYDVERTGFAVSLGKPLPGGNRVNVTYRLESSNIDDIADTNRYVYLDNPDEDFYFETEEDRISSSLRVQLTHDRRNNPFIPSAGNRVRLFGYVTGGPLGFDTDIYGLGLKTSSYVPLWFDHVLSLRTRWEIVDAYGSMDEVPLTDSLFLGGGRSLRGFDYRDVGPKVIPPDAPLDSTAYRPVGGKTLALGSVEYTIPLVKGLRLAGFFDIGNVWRDAYDFEFSDLASSAGVGLRLDMPGFPIRIDRAWTVEKDDDITQEDEWAIWIGFDN